MRACEIAERVNKLTFSMQIIEGDMLISGEIYTAVKNLTPLPTALVVTNFTSRQNVKINVNNFQVCSSLTQIAAGPQAETFGKMQTRENCRISALATNLEMVGGGRGGGRWL